jgi:hypothetical protein
MSGLERCPDGVGNLLLLGEDLIAIGCKGIVMFSMNTIIGLAGGGKGYVFVDLQLHCHGNGNFQVSGECRSCKCGRFAESSWQEKSRVARVAITPESTETNTHW